MVARPSSRALPALWKENLGPLVEFLNSVGQGVFGVVSDVKGERLAKAQVVLRTEGRPPLVLPVTQQGRSVS